MKKHIFILLIMLLFAFDGATQSKPVVKTILQGDEIAPDLSIFPAGFIPGRLLRPSFCPYLLMADTGNMEFLVLDQHMDIVHKVPAGENDAIHLLLLLGEQIKINSHKEIVGIIPKGPMLCISPDGEIKFTIDAEILEEKLGDAEFWLYRDSIVFNNGEPGIIDSRGHFLTGKALEAKKLEFLSQSSLMVDEAIRKKLLPLIEKEKGLLCGDYYLPPHPRALGQDYFDHYFSLLRKLYSIEELAKIESFKDSMEFLNYDILGNVYFHRVKPPYSEPSHQVYIFDKYGKFLKEVPRAGFLSAMGIGYQLEFYGDTKEYIMTAYTINQVAVDHEAIKAWFIEQTSEPQEAIPYVFPVDVESIKSSSVLKGHSDPDSYHPVKAFDSDSHSMWIEGDKNFGQDHWIEIEFTEPAKIDRIDFQPGCFWDIYWDQNNRIRQMTLLIDDESLVVNFKDIMKTQGISFSEAKDVRRIRFIINSVYRSKAWNDTAISEISFVYKDDPLLLNLNKYNAFLEPVK